MRVGDLVEWYDPVTLSGWDKSYEITELSKRSGVIIQLSKKLKYATVLVSCTGNLKKKKTKCLHIINESL